MDQKLKDIIESGLLELYVIGDLDATETSQVETWLRDYPELQTELVSIEKALNLYNASHAVTPPEGLIDIIKHKLPSNVHLDGVSSINNKPKSKLNYLMAASLIALLGLSLFYSYQLTQNLDEAESRLVDCEEDQKSKEREYLVYEQLKHRSNNIVLAEATEKYPETDIYIHNNVETKKTFLQIQNLPALASDQSFQLWSLKEGVDPIPLDVFEKLDGEIIEVNFEDDTQAYAITIEPKGGSKTPNLADLIGVFSINS